MVEVIDAQKECVVVVDAWKNCMPHDVEKHPHLPEETKAFGVYLNQMLKLIRPDYDIWHVPGNFKIMDEIDTSEDGVHDDILKIPSYKKYYFCGFHLGRCIQDRAHLLLNHLHWGGTDRIGIIFNLSILFPGDTYDKMREFKENHDVWFDMYNFIQGHGMTKSFAPFINMDAHKHHMDKLVKH
jgi:hypothetical protein